MQAERKRIGRGGERGRGGKRIGRGERGK